MGAREYPSTSWRIDPALWAELNAYVKATGRRKVWIFDQALREWMKRNPK